MDRCPFRPEDRGTEWPLQKRAELGLVEAAQFLGGQPVPYPRTNRIFYDFLGNSPIEERH